MGIELTKCQITVITERKCFHKGCGELFWVMQFQNFSNETMGKNCG